MPIGPITADERQLPDSILKSRDLFGPSFIVTNERLTPVPDGAIRTFFTQTPFVSGKLILIKKKVNGSTDWISVQDYDEILEGEILFKAGRQPLVGEDLRALLYLKPGTLERGKWVTNEGPQAGQLPDGIRTTFTTVQKLSSVILVTQDSIPLYPGEFSFVVGVASLTILPAPAIGSILRWSYIAT